MRRAQLSFGDGLIAEEVSDLRSRGRFGTPAEVLLRMLVQQPRHPHIRPTRRSVPVGLSMRQPFDGTGKKHQFLRRKAVRGHG
jgi:hypothetical protein